MDRSDWIIQYFDYLIKEFDFYVVKKEFDSQMMGNAFVLFKSSRVGIEIVIDRAQVLIAIGDQTEPREKWFDIGDVIKYFCPVEIPYIFYEKAANNTWDEAIKAQLRRGAFMLRQYCEPFLKGDLSMKKEIKETEKQRVTKMLKGFEDNSID